MTEATSAYLNQPVRARDDVRMSRRWRLENCGPETYWINVWGKPINRTPDAIRVRQIAVESHHTDMADATEEAREGYPKLEYLYSWECFGDAARRVDLTLSDFGG